MVAASLKYTRPSEDSSVLRELETASARLRAIHSRVRLAQVQRMRGRDDQLEIRRLLDEFDDAVVDYRACLERTLTQWQVISSDRAVDRTAARST